MWVVTQFSFDADIFIQWLESYQELLGSLPVYLGMPGPTQLKNLFFYAAQCGVDVNNLYVSQPDTGEQALEIIDTLVRLSARSKPL